MKKKCSFCNEKKLLSEFCKDKSRKDGHSYKCNECAHKYYLDNYKPSKKILKRRQDENGKECPECGEYKEYSEYNKNKRMKDGYAYYCRECYYKMIKDSRKTQHQRKETIRKTNKELDILAKKIADKYSLSSS